MENVTLRVLPRVAISVCFCFCPGSLQAQEIGTCDSPLGEAYLDTNHVRARILNTGGLFYRGEPHVYVVPRDSGVNAIFAGSLWIVGQVEGQLRAAATRYRNYEYWAGPLDDDGNPPVDCTIYDHVYSVRKTDLLDYEATGRATSDLRSWPTGLGAPTLDASGNLIDSSDLPFLDRIARRINLDAGERPAVRGDQDIWWVMNDRGNEHRSTRSLPMGIEVHGHAYAASTGIEAIDHATLYSFRLFNRNVFPITDAYIGVYLDADLGDAGDDYIGSDSLRGMGYVYNADNDDDEEDGGYGISPPALGMLFLEGPHADSDSKDNDRDGLIDEVGERLRTTAFGWFNNVGGVNETPETAAAYYTYLQGQWVNGESFTVGGSGYDQYTTSAPTNFLYSGNPVTGAYWSEMQPCIGCSPNPSSDRRFFLSSGPFSLDAGEDTDFTLAIVWARGKDHLDSVTELRKAADQIRIAFEGDYLTNPRTLHERTEPAEPGPVAALGHNYPEPFSDRTTIKYRVQEIVHVRLVIYDVLGREIWTLVNESQDEGEYAVVFDAMDMPSGVYFYKIEIDHASASRSMLLLK